MGPEWDPAATNAFQSVLELGPSCCTQDTSVRWIIYGATNVANVYGHSHHNSYNLWSSPEGAPNNNNNNRQITATPCRSIFHVSRSPRFAHDTQKTSRQYIAWLWLLTTHSIASHARLGPMLLLVGQSVSLAPEGDGYFGYSQYIRWGARWGGAHHDSWVGGSREEGSSPLPQ